MSIVTLYLICILIGKAKEISDSEDPHTVAQLFLQWFKIAKTPLIPSSLSLKLYASCLSKSKLQY
jgi:hypothetical protein